MKYLLLIHQNPESFQALSDEEKQAVFADVDTLMSELTASGEWVGGEGLADPSTARTVRVRDGVPIVTDGPYAEAKEQMVGYCIVDCDTEERAVEIAGRWPDARYWGMEVRAILSPGGDADGSGM
ncbi:MAG: YciI family protein [Actinomycetota bacterium]|nr:YciI family protein [Actinomycetota bacterium]